MRVEGGGLDQAMANLDIAVRQMNAVHDAALERIVPRVTRLRLTGQRRFTEARTVGGVARELAITRAKLGLGRTERPST